MRTTDAEGTAVSFFYDCKLPSVRKLRWFELLSTIIRDIAQAARLKLPISLDERAVSKHFQEAVSKAAKVLNKRIVLIFDEVEFISFKARLDPHWHADYIDFWQTIWAVQSQEKSLVFLIAGVNPTVVELSDVSGIQNPLFGIVQHEYLTGFTRDELRTMVHALGKRMGMKFSADGFAYLHERYGGHPLLSRLACSLINKASQTRNEKKPIAVTEQSMKVEQELRDSELTFYCGHIVSELREFYPDEYAMLEFLAAGLTSDFVELSANAEYVNHLYNYGLVAKARTGEPFIAIPVVGRFVGVELAKREKRKGIYRIVPLADRNVWLDRRKDLIVRDFRMLEKLAQRANAPLLFGPNSFPEADEFIRHRVCTDKVDFVHFINVLHRCFVESTENYGRHVGERDYLRNRIQQSFPALFEALERIRLYRHDQDHLLLRAEINRKTLDLLSDDFEGKTSAQVQDPYFVLQQRTLDHLLTALQLEVARLE